MYRILDEHQEVRERRNQLCHPGYSKPELLVTAPNQFWSWDITKLLGPSKWIYYYLYVILDVFSRYVVGWMIAERESATLAEELIAQTCLRQGIQRGQLTIQRRSRQRHDVQVSGVVVGGSGCNQNPLPSACLQ